MGWSRSSRAVRRIDLCGSWRDRGRCARRSCGTEVPRRLKSALQGDVAVLFARHGIDFRFEHAERADHARAGFVRLDDIVDEAALGGDEGVGEALTELFGLLAADDFLVGGGAQFPAV